MPRFAAAISLLVVLTLIVGPALTPIWATLGLVWMTRLSRWVRLRRFLRDVGIEDMIS